ncbi:MAG: hypothetical protein QOJ80_983 [Mycobacterium sp.]|jgi:hypothetical protein|nr:hypothetical protein [Mycobacterium sp.]
MTGRSTSACSAPSSSTREQKHRVLTVRFCDPPHNFMTARMPKDLDARRPDSYGAGLIATPRAMRCWAVSFGQRRQRPLQCAQGVVQFVFHDGVSDIQLGGYLPRRPSPKVRLSNHHTMRRGQLLHGFADQFAIERRSRPVGWGGIDGPRSATLSACGHDGPRPSSRCFVRRRARRRRQLGSGVGMTAGMQTDQHIQPIGRGLILQQIGEDEVVRCCQVLLGELGG